MTEPEHHKRYREAWEAYRKTGNPDLGRKMDMAQNQFTWDEFQAFKKTLPGFCEHWQGLKETCRNLMVGKLRMN